MSLCSLRFFSFRKSLHEVCCHGCVAETADLCSHVSHPLPDGKSLRTRAKMISLTMFLCCNILVLGNDLVSSWEIIESYLISSHGRQTSGGFNPARLHCFAEVGR
jgi:hypothetical protein